MGQWFLKIFVTPILLIVVVLLKLKLLHKINLWSNFQTSQTIGFREYGIENYLLRNQTVLSIRDGWFGYRWPPGPSGSDNGRSFDQWLRVDTRIGRWAGRRYRRRRSQYCNRNSHILKTELNWTSIYRTLENIMHSWTCSISDFLYTMTFNVKNVL